MIGASSRGRSVAVLRVQWLLGFDVLHGMLS